MKEGIPRKSPPMHQPMATGSDSRNSKEAKIQCQGRGVEEEEGGTEGQVEGRSGSMMMVVVVVAVIRVVIPQGP
jgi:hypothetical protein